MISVSHHTVGGPVTGTILRGREPMPWLLFTITTHAQVWDRNGKPVTYPVKERVLVQGAANVQALADRIRPGVSVLAIGQGVPAHVVAADADVRGSVLLAQLIQTV
jgi:hypothetical protein